MAVSLLKSSDKIIQEKLRKFRGCDVTVNVAYNSGIKSITIKDVNDKDNRNGFSHTPMREEFIKEYLNKECKRVKVS